VKLLAKDIFRQGQECHFARPSIRVLAPGKPHSHDFDEIFWIDEGRGWHWINGERRELRAGMLVAIRAADRHAFSAESADGFRMVNIAFPADVWRGLRRRYGPALVDLFRASHVCAREHFLGGARWPKLENISAEISAGARHRLAVERFLLNAHALLSEAKEAIQLSGMPPWLELACREIAHPQQFRNGTAALVELAGRSAEHVARAARRYVGRTPTEIVNAARMIYAAARLSDSNDSILDIALECGFENLGHFYEVFRARFGTTPKHYRNQARRIVRPTA
jgi:AraC-like DNA-binding protein